MAAHIGIELSSGVCRIVDVDVSRTKAGLRPVRVRRFSTFQYSSAEMAAALAELRGRSAAVIVWGAPGDHRQVMVTTGRYEAMRKEASRSLAKAGVETRGAMVDIARVSSANGPAARRPVVVALASGAAVSAAIQPVVEAGIDVRTLATPATALASLARVKRSFAPDGPAVRAEEPTLVDVYVAIEERAICITLLRDGSIVAARELSWGFQEGRRGLLRRREDIAARFGDELAEFLATVGGSLRSLRHVTMCGAVPDLRSIAAALTERFDVEVEPLDSLFGVDAPSGSEAESALTEHCAAMWLPWAAAVDQPAALSLLHARHRTAAQMRFARAAIAAGVMVGVGLGWQAAHCELLRAEPLPAVHRSAKPKPVETAEPAPLSRDVQNPER